MLGILRDAFRVMKPHAPAFRRGEYVTDEHQIHARHLEAWKSSDLRLLMGKPLLAPA